MTTLTPPELAWLPIHRLTVDVRYQRALDSERSKRLIEKIASEFSWRKFQVLTTVDQGDGWWEIVDGQHRTEGVKKRGGIDHIPASVFKNITPEDRAAMFIAVNRDRISVTPLQMFKSRLAAGDPVALATKARCDRVGIKIAPCPISKKDIPLGTTLALGAIESLARRFGESVADAAVRCVADAYRGIRGGLRADVFTACGSILLSQLADREALAVRLTEVLKSTSSDKLEIEALTRRGKNGGTVVSNTETILREMLQVTKPVEQSVQPAKIVKAGSESSKPFSMFDGRGPSQRHNKPWTSRLHVDGI